MLHLPFQSPFIHRPRQLPTTILRRRKSIGWKLVWAQSKPKYDDTVEDDDPFVQAATRAASLRLQDARRSDPLIHDTYSECLVSSTTPRDMNQKPASTCYYHLATKFIDDKLLGMMKQSDDLRQIVLLTDGMDTRPYRLTWPRSTLIFDISPGKVFRTASKRLQGHEAKVPRGCMLIHVPQESDDIIKVLHRKGFSGNRPSIWVLQSDLQKQMDKIFLSNGFQVDMISFEEIAENYNRDLLSEEYENALFVAEQLQLSDDQMESWWREFRRMEDEGDEEGFEDW